MHDVEFLISVVGKLRARKNSPQQSQKENHLRSLRAGIHMGPVLS